MLIHLSNIVQRGIIDNTTRGQVELRLWYHQDKDPLEYILEGDCCRDIAGCRVSFENRAAIPKPEGDWDALVQLALLCKKLQAGDITLSRLQQDENSQRTLRRMLSIEFFADTRFRVLVDVDYFDFDISPAAWQLNWEEANLRSLLSRDSLRDHINTCVELYSLHQVSTDSEDFERCSWDEVLNQAESRAAIYRTIREKYYGQDNSLSSTAYVLDMPQLLGPWIREDRHVIPSRVYDHTRTLILFDYLETAHRRPVHRAMQHALFHHTNELTQLVSSSLQRLMEKNHDMQEQAEEVMQLYSRIVSRILATILLHQQSKREKTRAQYRDMLLGRVKHLYLRLKQVITKLPAGLDNERDIRHTAVKLHAELRHFRLEIQR